MDGGGGGGLKKVLQAPRGESGALGGGGGGGGGGGFKMFQRPLACNRDHRPGIYTSKDYLVFGSTITCTMNGYRAGNKVLAIGN